MENEKTASLEESSLPAEEITSDTEGYTVDASVTKDDWVELKRKIIQNAERGLIIFGVVLLLSIACIKIFAVNLLPKILSSKYTENLTYAEVPGGYAVTGYDPLSTDTYGSVDIVIPKRYNGKPVVAIANLAFDGDNHIRTVTIPDGVRSIGSDAFHSCSSLTSVTIPDSVTSIGRRAFAFCSGLTSVTIPDSVTSISDYAFYGCSDLTSVTIGEGVTSIGGRVFYSCDSLNTIYYKGTAEEWDSISIESWDSSFTSATCYYYSKTEPTEEGYFWHYVDGVAAVWENYSKGLLYTSGGNGTCYVSGTGTCTDTDIVIPSVSPNGDRVTSIGNYAFSDCSGLTSVTIGEGVTSIGGSAFSSCTGLTSVTIGDSVTSIGAWAFSGCTSLRTVYYKGTAEEWSSIEGWNSELTYATRYYYSENEPTESGNFWHYNDEGEIVKW